MQHPDLEEHQDDVEGGTHTVDGPGVHRRPAQQWVAGDVAKPLSYLLAHGGVVLRDDNRGLWPANAPHRQACHHEAESVHEKGQRCGERPDEEPGETGSDELGPGVTEGESSAGLVEAGRPHQRGKVGLPGNVVEGGHETDEEGDRVQYLDVEAAQRPEHGYDSEHGCPPQSGIEEHRTATDPF